MQFFEWSSHVISHYPVEFGVHRTCGIGVICNVFLFVMRLHITTWSKNITTQSCDYVHGDQYHSYHLGEFGSHELCKNRDKTFFIRHSTIVLCDHCGWWHLLVNQHPVKFCGYWPCGIWNITFLICHVTSPNHMNERTDDI